MPYTIAAATVIMRPDGPVVHLILLLVQIMIGLTIAQIYKLMFLGFCALKEGLFLLVFRSAVGNVTK